MRDRPAQWPKEPASAIMTGAARINRRTHEVGTLGPALRWAHIVTGAAWLGEVVVIVFVLVPLIPRLDTERRGWFLATVFPRIFRLASVLSVAVLLTGWGVYLSTTDWRWDLKPLVTGRWGWAILVGGSLGLLLALFHFVVEGRLEPQVRAAREAASVARLVRAVQIIPRGGLAVLLLIFALMTYAARS